MFEISAATVAKLTSYTGRTERHGDEEVPAVSYRLKITGPNTLLDLLSTTLRKTVYMPVEDQEQLPGIEEATPILRSKDIKQLSLDNCFEGWTVTIEHGIDDESALVMGGCKIDQFKIDLHDGGTVEIEFRVGTSDIDAEGAGLLWAKQKQEVTFTARAPVPKASVIDGTQAAFDADYPPPEGDEDASEGGNTDLHDADWPFPCNGARTPEEALAAAIGSDS